MKIRCLIVDDEPIARQIVEKYCSLLPEIEVVATCANAIETKKIIQNRDIDLLFLDINMPVLDGMAFIRTLSKAPLIILTTAYKEYAPQAFDLAVCDYLLKPFSFERFIIAVDKVSERLESKGKAIVATSSEDYRFIKADGKIYKINFAEVSYAEADGNNVKIITGSSMVRPAITFNALEAMLPKLQFIRLHRSFIINKNKINRIEGNRVFIGNAEIPIGANYREHFFREINIR